MQLYFIRHGESINNVNWNNPDYAENPDPFLTEKGIEQAEHLARYLQKNKSITDDMAWNVQNHCGFELTHIYASLMEGDNVTVRLEIRL